MLKTKHIKIVFISLLTLLLVACGSSDTSKNINTNENNETSQSVDEPTTATTAPTINQAPIAKAGADQQVNLGTTVLLDASQSTDDKGIVSYTWSLDKKVVSHEKSVALDNLSEGSYLYTLTVTDEQNATATDSIEIRTYDDDVVEFQTVQGNILLKMMSNVAPLAVENFTTHTKNGYYDGVIFHRVIKDFMIQGGDPTGTGRGGKSIWGTPFSNEIDPNVVFDRPFILAMANAGGTKTNGSQFFITTKEASFLNGKYTIFGEVVQGKEVVSKIENIQTNRQDRPNVKQTIIKASLYFEKK